MSENDGMRWADASAALDRYEIVRRKIWAPTVSIRKNDRGGLIYAGTGRAFVLVADDRRADDWEVWTLPTVTKGMRRKPTPSLHIRHSEVARAVVACIRVAREVSVEAARLDVMGDEEREAFVSKLMNLDDVMDTAVAATAKRRWLVPLLEHGGVAHV